MVAKVMTFVYTKKVVCFGTVAKWKSDGLQNRYATVRFCPVPPKEKITMRLSFFIHLRRLNFQRYHSRTNLKQNQVFRNFWQYHQA